MAHQFTGFTAVTRVCSMHESIINLHCLSLRGQGAIDIEQGSQAGAQALEPVDPCQAILKVGNASGEVSGRGDHGVESIAAVGLRGGRLFPSRATGCGSLPVSSRPSRLATVVAE